MWPADRAVAVGANQPRRREGAVHPRETAAETVTAGDGPVPRGDGSSGGAYIGGTERRRPGTLGNRRSSWRRIHRRDGTETGWYLGETERLLMAVDIHRKRNGKERVP